MARIHTDGEGAFRSPTAAPVILESSTGLGALDTWTEITRVDLNPRGLGTIANAMPGGTNGVPRYFVRLGFPP